MFIYGTTNNETKYKDDRGYRKAYLENDIKSKDNTRETLRPTIHT